MKNYFNTNLKFIRTQKGLTQEQFSKMLDKDYSTIGKWENGSRTPILEDVVKLSEILNVSVSDLVVKDLRLKESTNKDCILTDSGIKISIPKNKTTENDYY